MDEREVNSIMKHDTKQIGLRIRTARKKKGMNQTQLAAALGKSLRTIQKYESGEIEVSLAMINELAGVLDTTSTYLTGYDTQEKPLTNMADVMQFLFQLDQIRELGFRIDVKRPPEHDRWECSITFNGKDLSSSENADMCLFLEEFRENREEYAAYGHSASSYQDWKDKTLAYYAAVPLSETETEELTEEERISRRNAFLKEQFRS